MYIDVTQITIKRVRFVSLYREIISETVTTVTEGQVTEFKNNWVFMGAYVCWVTNITVNSAKAGFTFFYLKRLTKSFYSLP